MAYGAGMDGFGELEAEFELEGLGEYEFENEFEFEAEGEGYVRRPRRRRFRRPYYRPAAPGGWATWQDDDDAEAFGLGDVASGVAKGWNWLTTPDSTQRKVALATTNAILDAAPGLLAKVNPIAGAVAGVASAGLKSVLPDKEFEWEFESEDEFEGEFEDAGMVSPVSRVYSDAMMEHIGRAAMEAEGEMEAAEHVMALVPIAASKALPAAARAMAPAAGRVVPHVANVIARATPHLTHGVTNLTRTLHRDPRSRPLVRAVPTVARAAVEKIARHAAKGHAVSPHHALHLLARENHRILSNPRLITEVLQRAHGMDRRFRHLGGVPVSAAHRAAGQRPAVCPACGRPAVPGARVCGC